VLTHGNKRPNFNAQRMEAVRYVSEDLVASLARHLWRNRANLPGKSLRVEVSP
jgi:hypothetical protein